MADGIVYDVRKVLGKIAQNMEKLKDYKMRQEAIGLMKRYSPPCNLNRIPEVKIRHDLEIAKGILQIIQEGSGEYGYQR